MTHIDDQHSSHLLRLFSMRSQNSQVALRLLQLVPSLQLPQQVPQPQEDTVATQVCT